MLAIESKAREIEPISLKISSSAIFMSIPPIRLF